LEITTEPIVINTTEPAAVPLNRVNGSKASAPVHGKKESDAPRTMHSLQTVPLRRKQEPMSEASTAKEEIILLNQPFTTEALLRSWNIFVETIKEDLHLTNALKACPPVQKEDYEIEVTVQNQSIENKVQNLSRQIENHLHHHLKNNRIKLNIRMAEEGENARPFTSRDRLDSMIKKNPNMELLYRTFGLDIN
jgi:DNA polymerase III subunit gamma/tau